MLLTGPNIHQAAITAGIPPWVIVGFSDASYMAPDSAWVADFHKWFLATLDAFGVREYKPESGDCDDFADLFASFARLTHRRTSPDCGAALPVGRFDFAQNPDAAPEAKQLHAIVWIFTRDQGLIFIEPQVLFRIEKLTAKQIASCIRFSD